MKLEVRITPKVGVLDPEARAVQHTLVELGYTSVSEVGIGKLITLDLDTEDPAQARAWAREMCEKLLANPVIEQYEIRGVRS